MATQFKEVYPEDFKPGLRFKDYPDAPDIYEMKSVDISGNLVLVRFSRPGEEQTYPWSGRNGEGGTPKSFVWAEVEVEGNLDEDWQAKAVSFFSISTSQQIADAIAGITMTAADRVLSHKPLTWNSFVEAKLTNNQMQAISNHFQNT